MVLAMGKSIAVNQDKQNCMESKFAKECKLRLMPVVGICIRLKDSN